MIVPVILSGGSGTRLWPLSRAMFPKQFVRVFSHDGESLLTRTLRRLAPGDGISAPVVVCNQDHRFLVADELARARIKPQAVLLEPVGRNTAPAIAAAALFLAERDADALMAVMPCDHAVGDETAFLAATQRAASLAAQGRVVLFGVTPTSAHTGYGYIQRGAGLAGDNDVFAVAAFCEKPDRRRAKEYLTTGNHLWNSGIFVMRARTAIAKIQRHAPGVLAAVREALAKSRLEDDMLRLDRRAFATAEAISFDYAVMERTEAAVVLPLDAGWSDVGTWASLWQAAPRDAADNAVAGDALLVDTTGCMVHAERSLVATVGVRDLIVIDTPDALLVADKSRAEDVSGVVSRLRQSNRREHEAHLRTHRPWGFFETLSAGPGFQVKLLSVKPGGKLSRQLHQHRSEHWVVVRGTATVTIDDVLTVLNPNQGVYITAGHWHRLENAADVPLEIIEVQTGSYLGEDDIVRSEDAYNRTCEEAAE